MRRQRQRGQAIIELAILFPFLLLVFMGSWTAAALIANNDTAAQVSGYGARVAAEIGNGCSLVGGTVSCTKAVGSCQQTATDPCAVDHAVISAMTPALNSQLSNSSVKYIYIYQPGACLPSGGVLPPLSSCTVTVGNGAGATLKDQYQYCASTSQWVLTDPVSGTTTLCASLGLQVGGVAPYTLDLRTQTVADEQAIGVALKFTFTSPAPVLSYFSQTDTTYTAITFPPQGS